MSEQTQTPTAEQTAAQIERITEKLGKRVLTLEQVGALNNVDDGMVLERIEAGHRPNAPVNGVSIRVHETVGDKSVTHSIDNEANQIRLMAQVVDGDTNEVRQQSVLATKKHGHQWLHYDPAARGIDRLATVNPLKETQVPLTPKGQRAAAAKVLWKQRKAIANREAKLQNNKDAV